MYNDINHWTKDKTACKSFVNAKKGLISMVFITNQVAKLAEIIFTSYELKIDGNRGKNLDLRG